MSKILLFCSNIYPGGVVRVFSELVDALVDDEYQAAKYTVLASEDCALAQSENSSWDISRLAVKSKQSVLGAPKQYGHLINKICVRLLQELCYFPIQIENIRKMRAYLRTHHFDAVLAHSGGYPGDELCMQMLEAARKEGITQRVLVLHNYPEKRQGIGILLGYGLDHKTQKNVTDLYTVSNASRAKLTENTTLKQNIGVLYNGLGPYETEKKIGTKNEKCSLLGLTNEQLVVGMVGNFESRKGQMYFLEAVRMLIKSGAKCQFVIIGNILDKEYYDQCIKFLEKNHLQQKLKICHNIFPAAPYVECFDVMVFPSIAYESFGLVSLEAMMYGVPVVAFAQGGIIEVVDDGATGFCVKTGNTNELVEKIQVLLLNQAKRTEMGNCALLRYNMLFTANKMGSSYTNALFTKRNDL